MAAPTGDYSASATNEKLRLRSLRVQEVLQTLQMENMTLKRKLVAAEGKALTEEEADARMAPMKDRYEKELAELRNEADGLRQQLQAAEKGKDDAEAARSQTQSEMSFVMQELSDAQAALTELQTQLEKLQSEHESADETLQQSLSQVKLQLEAVTNERDGLLNKLSEAAGGGDESELLKQTVAEMEASVERLTAELEVARRSLRDGKGMEAELTEALQLKYAELSDMSNRCTSAEDELARLREQCDRMASEHAQLSEAYAALLQQQRMATGAGRAKFGEYVEWKRENERLQSEVAKIKRTLKPKRPKKAKRRADAPTLGEKLPRLVAVRGREARDVARIVRALHGRDGRGDESADRRRI
eukprot:PLAT13256.1.p1 GENE.PLAT13256.1~~PLAT13256.1.p1  ORF type:complete len:369 (+),score=126.18 PLAT13256.1:29-1108(+)